MLRVEVRLIILKLPNRPLLYLIGPMLRAIVHIIIMKLLAFGLLIFFLYLAEKLILNQKKEKRNPMKKSRGLGIQNQNNFAQQEKSLHFSDDFRLRSTVIQKKKKKKTGQKKVLVPSS